MKKFDRRASLKLRRQVKHRQLNLGNLIEDINLRFDQTLDTNGFKEGFNRIIEETGIIDRLAEVYLQSISQLYEEMSRLCAEAANSEDSAAVRQELKLKADTLAEGLPTALMGAVIGRHLEVALSEKAEKQNGHLDKQYADNVRRQLVELTWPQLPTGVAMPGRLPEPEEEKAQKAEEERKEYLDKINSALREWKKKHRTRNPTQKDIALIVESDKNPESAPVIFSKKLKKFGINFKSLIARED